MKRWVKIFAGISLVAVTLSGCNQVSFNKNIYTEDNMSHFYSDKVAIEDLSSIDVDSSYADFEIIASDGYYVEYSYYYINNEPELKIVDHKLTFSDLDINHGSYSISTKKNNYLKIYIPTTTEFDNIEIKKSSGDCSIGSFAANQVSVQNEYGDTIISGCKIDQLETDMSSGSLVLEKSILNKATIDNTYGEVTIDTINASSEPVQSLELDLSSGKLNFDNVNCKDLSLENTYGENDFDGCVIDSLHGSLSSGNLEIERSEINNIDISNEYGNMDFELYGSIDDYKYDVSSEYGSVTIGDKTYDGSVLIDRGSEKEIKLELSSGNVKIRFLNK